MKDVLPLLVNYKERFQGYKVETKDIKEKYFGSEDTYDATVTTLYGITESGEKIGIRRIHTGYMSSWDDEQTQILHDITKPLNDFERYRWKDIKRPLMNYWRIKRKEHVLKQERKGVKNTWKLGGDSTLWRWAHFMSSVLIAKYQILGTKGLPEILENKDEFITNFDKLVLEPLFLFLKLEDIHNDESDLYQRVKETIDVILNFSKGRIGAFDNLLDPSYKSTEGFISSEEERELGALYSLYDDIQKDIDSEEGLDSIEKRIKMIEFWNSYQGKRLETLKSMKVYGGNMSFDEKEDAKRERVKEIVGDLHTVLASWGNEHRYIDQGLKYYQEVYEKEVYARQKREYKHQTMVENSKGQVEEYSDILKGLWNGDHLNFIGIMIGIIVSFGLTLGTIVPKHQWLIGIGSSVAATIVFIFLFKCSWTRRKLSEFSKWVLSPQKLRNK